jgi:SAM-dependent methyltransferase
VVFLAGRGARVHVDEVEVPQPIPKKQPGEPAVTVPPFKIDHASGTFDLVLAWELFDFVSPDRLQEFGQEIVRVVREGGQLMFFAHLKPPSDRAVLPRYRLLADDLIVREEPKVPPIPRYVHSNLMIERAIAGLGVQNIHLQRNQMREILASKAGVG